jgi:hypothetical protein
MKYLVTLFFIAFTSITFAQGTGLIIGKVLDKELDNTPLAFANISLKGASINAVSDISGVFLLENLKDGNYTLVCDFPGYQTKEISIKVDAAIPTEVKLSLSALVLAQTETTLVENTETARVLP